MKLENHLLISILEQAEASDSSTYTAPDMKSALHVAVLADRGFVVAKLGEDGAEKIEKAQIVRITSKGYDVLAAQHRALQNIPSAPMPNATDEIRKEAKESIKRENAAYETRLCALAGGGLAFTFHLGRFCIERQIEHGLIVPMATLFGATLILQLLSHSTSQEAYDGVLSKCIGLGSRGAKFWNGATRVLNALAFLALLGGLTTCLLQIIRAV